MTVKLRHGPPEADESEHRGSSSHDAVLQLAEASAGEDRYRREFVTLVRRARALSATRTPGPEPR